MSTTAITPIKKTVGFRTKGITINGDGTLFAQFELVSGDQAGGYKVLAEKNYMLTAEEAASVVDVKGKGTIREDLTSGLVALLSKRQDWLI